MIEQLISGINCGQFQTIILISPDHFHQVSRQNNWLTDEQGYTLLKKSSLSSALKDSTQISDLQTHADHGITAVNKFLQEKCPTLHILPLVLSQDEKAMTQINQLGTQLTYLQNSLLLISSDFSHGQNLDQTQHNDQLSLQGLKEGNFNNIENDCPACWSFLTGFLGAKPIFQPLNHRNSFDYTNHDHDITSYITG